MQLHWSPKSPFVRKVLICAHELGLEGRLELVRSVVDMRRPNAALMAHNPLGKLPTLVLDDGQVIFDSLVICAYLDTMAEGALFPDPGPRLWEALNWHALGNGLMDILVLWRNERDKPPEARTDAWISSFRLKSATTLDYFERLTDDLADRPFGIGQVTVGSALSYMDFRFATEEWRRGRPALSRWFETFEARRSVRRTQIVDG